MKLACGQHVHLLNIARAKVSHLFNKMCSLRERLPRRGEGVKFPGGREVIRYFE
jgi:hypothetical protein